MRFMFAGGTRDNSGPSNVNIGIINNLTSNFAVLGDGSRLSRTVRIIWLCARCNLVVLSGTGKQNYIIARVARCFRKRIVYIMHGCLDYEYKLNNITGNDNRLMYERYLLKHASLLLPVSKKFMYWAKAYFPQYAHKMKYLFNGIDMELLPLREQYADSREGIIAAGGDRRQKMNEELCCAVESLDGLAKLTVYGRTNKPHNEGFRQVKYAGNIPYDQFMQKLSHAKLFVLNSIFEPFSLAAIEALMCGCSVLLSEKAGVTDILELEECDLIHDPHDIEEIRTKIRYLLEHPNNRRILEKLNIDDYSYTKQVERLEKLCYELLKQ